MAKPIQLINFIEDIREKSQAGWYCTDIARTYIVARLTMKTFMEAHNISVRDKPRGYFRNE